MKHLLSIFKVFGSKDGSTTETLLLVFPVMLFITFGRILTITLSFVYLPKYSVLIGAMLTVIPLLSAAKRN